MPPHTLLAAIVLAGYMQHNTHWVAGTTPKTTSGEAQKPRHDPAVLTGFGQSFVRRDGAVIHSLHASTVQWVLDIMDRQHIPRNASALRALPDGELMSVAMRAAVAGISHWRREAGSDRIVVNDASGIPYAEDTVVDIELPMYITIICIMGGVILLQQMRLQPVGAP